MNGVTKKIRCQLEPPFHHLPTSHVILSQESPFMNFIESVEELEDRLATPNSLDVEVLRRLEGDVIILGAGGKMGPSLARRIRRAVIAAGTHHKVTAVSRFSSASLVDELNRDGIETIACDLLDRNEVAKLPLYANVLFLLRQKVRLHGPSGPYLGHEHHHSRERREPLSFRANRRVLNRERLPARECEFTRVG